MVTKLVTKMVTKEPCSIFSVRLYAPTVSQTVGNTRVTEGFGGDEGDLNIDFSEPLTSTLPALRSPS